MGLHGEKLQCSHQPDQQRQFVRVGQADQEEVGASGCGGNKWRSCREGRCVAEDGKADRRKTRPRTIRKKRELQEKESVRTQPNS